MEEKVLKRGWVKNAAIIFLAVMLVLTFFSNTIMNRSLPEISTSTIMSGPIESKVRGTGTVSSNENYEVIIKQSRKVKSVMVKTGQEVSTGDVLFVLESGDSEEIKAAQAELKNLKNAYQEALINASGTEGIRMNNQIEELREKLEAARNKLGESPVTDSQIASAKAAVTAAETAVKPLEADVERYQGYLNSIGGGSGGENLSALRKDRDDRAKEKETAASALRTIESFYGGDYDKLEELAKQNIISDTPNFSEKTKEEQDALIDLKLDSYVAAAAETCKGNSDPNYPYSYYEAYENITAAEAALVAADAALKEAETAYTNAVNNDSSGIAASYRYQLEKAQEKLDEANTVLDKAKTALENLEKQREEREAAESVVDELEKSLSNTLLDQQDLGKNQQITALHLQQQRDAIAEQEELIASLSGEGGDSEIKATVNGIVQSISVSAGHVANADTALAVIEVPDLGYSLSFSVTNDQARLVHVGDVASVSNYYWGSQIDAVLESIKTDSKNPQSNKILTFNVTGDVSNGTSLTLAVGERSSNYDYVVPNSAIRSDSNGSFVLVINAKNSPLGTRYTAVRVDVEVVASDDKNSAVTGALNVNDYVLTTSNKPVANGDQVRLADTNS